MSRQQCRRIGYLPYAKFILPGVKIKSTCPKCGEIHEFDGNSEGLRHPRLDMNNDIDFDCKCGESWSVPVRIEISVTIGD